jgi:hypothetical protein
MSSAQIPRPLTPPEVTQVARYHAFRETAGGFVLPSSESTDRHFFFSLPGVSERELEPAVMYYRTRHSGRPTFSVRINDVTVSRYTFVDGDEAERTWHEIIVRTTGSGPILRPGPDNNELIFSATDGSVIVGDVVILYTSNQTTVPDEDVAGQNADPDRA